MVPSTKAICKLFITVNIQDLGDYSGSLLAIPQAATMIQLHPLPIISRLPPEIMSEIFLSACPPWHLNDKHEPVNSGLSPLFLGRICRSWRDIAWSTPTLWCSLVIRITKAIPKELQKELVVQWITRAKNLPLSVAMRLKDDNKLKAGKELEAILEVLATHAMQWRVVNFSIPPATSMRRILSRIERRMPNLISISLGTACRSSGLPLYSSSILPLMTLPALRRLSLHMDTDESIDLINAMLSRSSFPALEVLALTSSHCFILNEERKMLDLLAGLPSLVEVRLHGRGLAYAEFLTDLFIDMLHPLHCVRNKAFPVVILPNLRVFVYEGPIRGLNADSLADMLSYRWRCPQAHGHMAQLTRVAIETPHTFPISEENARTFEKLIADGMDLDLKFPKLKWF